MSQPNNIIKQKKRQKTILWGGVFLLCAMVTFFVFIVRLWYIQNTDEEGIKNKISRNYKVDTIRAARGNLYATDGSILATTVMRYEIYLDFEVMTKKKNLYNDSIGALTDSLAAMFEKPKYYYKELFEKQKNKKNRYFSLAKNLDFNEYDRIRKFPIFKKGRAKAGFIVQKKYKRELATSEIGAGTIGEYNDNNKSSSGFERAFSEHLAGKDGWQLVQKINSTQWKPIDFWNKIDPEDGKDVYTTLDLRIQDISRTALAKQLEAFNAEFGSVVVMEVKTGKVRALVNLKNENGELTDAYNYAVRDNIEPGSTFKVVSLLTAMDDGYIDNNTTVNVGGGVWTYKGQTITDDHGGGTYDISQVLSNSSNVGTSKLITKYYSAKPEVFFNHLKRWKLFEKVDIELGNISTPKFITPQHKGWNAAGLASTSFGYNVNINMLQLAMFYNGIANKGKIVKPLFIDKIMKDGEITYEAKTNVLVEKMASNEAIQMMTNALVQAVEKGTARSIFTPNLKMAGKTGTARYNYAKNSKGGVKYRASFAGFFPADDPVYTCFVIINNPDKSISYYGGTVAAPVFKEIAGKTFLKEPQNIEKEILNAKKVDLKTILTKKQKISIQNEIMPEVKGQNGKDIVVQLENAGYRVAYSGVGKVIDQLPLAGVKLKKNQRIYLTLEK